MIMATVKNLKTEVKNLFSFDAHMLPSSTICICQNEADMAAVEQAYDIELERLGLDGQVSLVYNDATGDKFILIYIDLDAIKAKDKAVIAALCAHEAYHAAALYFRDFLGEDEPGEEITAYVLQSFTRLILEELNQKGWAKE